MTLFLKLSQKRMDQGNHCTSARYSHICVAEREIAKDSVRNNLYVHSRASSDVGVAVGPGSRDE